MSFTDNLDLTAWKGIMVVCEFRDRQPDPVTFELMGKARELADAVGQDVSAVVIGSGVLEAARELLLYPVDRVIVYDSPLFGHFVAEAWADALEHAVMTHKPGTILIGATHQGRSFAPRLAVRLRTGLTADCTCLEMRPNGELLQIRPAFGGNIMAAIVTRHHRPQMATVRYRVMPRAERGDRARGEIVPVNLAGTSLEQRIMDHLGRIKVLAQKPLPRATSIADAEVIVACGRGVRAPGDLAMFKELADLLGGVLACSRPLVEKGWLDSSHQVGQSGRTVRPKIYIACGISGAIQHIAGMSNSGTIIAINTDRYAPIFGVAHYAVVGDIYEIVPRLIEILKTGPGTG